MIHGDLKRLTSRLAESRQWGYGAQSPSAVEPAAMAALALLGSGLRGAGVRPLQWLERSQTPEGVVAPGEFDAEPVWPTALALVAWRAADHHPESNPTERRWGNASDLALAALLRARGETWPATGTAGHDPSLAGWPWVAGTHSWCEPTAYAVWALKASALALHARAREGVRMLLDRILPEGGCNYGNTVVLGQALRPQAGPTGVVLTALRGEVDQDGRVVKSINYLERSIGPGLGTVSLCQAIIGLAAHGRAPGDAQQYLAAKAARLHGSGWSPWKASLVILAGLGGAHPLFQLMQGSVS